MKKLFFALSALLLILVGIAALKDSQSRQYLAIQQQYQKDYPNDPPFNTGVQQLFPQFQGAKVGDVYRAETCISCHVVVLQQIGSDQAAKRLACDFFQNEPNAQQIKQEFGLQSSGSGSPTDCMSAHPVVITQSYYAKNGPNASANGFSPYSVGGQPVNVPGWLQSNVDPAAPANAGVTLNLESVGCVVCHNGNRQGLTETDAHQNLVVNPSYVWSAGTALYYQYCATCHGQQGLGGVGPPLNNQDRLGFFNADYYQRCITYGATGFEHLGSVMPAWGTAAPDFKYNPQRDKPQFAGTIHRTLSDTQIQVLIQYIREWEQYSTLP